MPDDASLGTSSDETLLLPGRTCWRIERSEKVAFLVDGEAYFAAVRAAIAAARHSIFILGWDIDSRMRLVPDGARDGYPEPLGAFLDAVVRERHALRAYVLAWDYAMLYAFEREWLPIYQFGWKTHRRLSFHLDDQHPVGACHHQKIVVVDDAVAFLGGFDLTQRRWDTPEHGQGNPLRKDAERGEPYGPFHDVGAAVSGDCAHALGELARERWQRATGKTPRAAPAEKRSGCWPEGLNADLSDVAVAIVRTEPTFGPSSGVSEVRELHVQAIAAAKHWIFGENQYFTSSTIARAFARRLALPDPPEIALIVPRNQSGWLESSTMGVLRARLHRMLRNADRHDRYRLYCPALTWMGSGSCLNVHSKLMIVDDRLLTLGSANLSDRSLFLDTECNIAIEARGDERIANALAGLRERLLAEHLGSTPDAVALATRREGSLHRTIEALAGNAGRALVATHPALDPVLDGITPDHGVVDPEKPLDPDLLVADLLPQPEGRRGLTHRLLAVVLIVLAFAALALAWRYTPLGQWIEFDRLVSYADALGDSWYAPLAVPVAYVIAGLLVVPLTALIVVTAAVFGPLAGGIYAMLGALLSGCVTYAIGRNLGRATVRRIAGRRLNELSRHLGRRALIAVVIVRLLPIAPYSIVNIVAGASHIGWRDFLIGTALGLAPGIILAMLFVDRALAAIRHPGPGTYAVLAAVAALVAIVGWSVRRVLARSASAGGASVKTHAA